MDKDSIVYYGEFEGRSPHKGDIISTEVYFADINGELYGASNEIAEYMWLNLRLDEIQKYNICKQ